MKIKHTLGLISTVLLIAVALPTWAGEGHGHGEGPAAEAGKPSPSVTAVSESFELVGRLHHDELSILIDRASTTEPVLNASLNVEVDGRSATAPFHADQGDYSLTDPELLAKLHKVGSKSLVFTLVTGSDSDLLSGELDVHDEALAASGALRSWKDYAAWTGLMLAGLVVLTFLFRRLQASRKPRLGGAA
jgi:hypothetical protein